MRPPANPSKLDQVSTNPSTKVIAGNGKSQRDTLMFCIAQISHHSVDAAMTVFHSFFVFQLA
jgi:hypothetical protein